MLILQPFKFVFRILARTILAAIVVFDGKMEQIVSFYEDKGIDKNSRKTGRSTQKDSLNQKPGNSPKRIKLLLDIILSPGQPRVERVTTKSVQDESTESKKSSLLEKIAFGIASILLLATGIVKNIIFEFFPTLGPKTGNESQSRNHLTPVRRKYLHTRGKGNRHERSGTDATVFSMPEDDDVIASANASLNESRSLVKEKRKRSEYGSTDGNDEDSDNDGLVGTNTKGSGLSSYETPTENEDVVDGATIGTLLTGRPVPCEHIKERDYESKPGAAEKAACECTSDYCVEDDCESCSDIGPGYECLYEEGLTEDSSLISQDESQPFLEPVSDGEAEGSNKEQGEFRESTESQKGTKEKSLSDQLEELNRKVIEIALKKQAEGDVGEKVPEEWVKGEHPKPKFLSKCYDCGRELDILQVLGGTDLPPCGKYLTNHKSNHISGELHVKFDATEQSIIDETLNRKSTDGYGNEEEKEVQQNVCGQCEQPNGKDEIVNEIKDNGTREFETAEDIAAMILQSARSTIEELEVLKAGEKRSEHEKGEGQQAKDECQQAKDESQQAKGENPQPRSEDQETNGENLEDNTVVHKINEDQGPNDEDQNPRYENLEGSVVDSKIGDQDQEASDEDKEIDDEEQGDKSKSFCGGGWENDLEHQIDGDEDGFLMGSANTSNPAMKEFWAKRGIRGSFYGSDTTASSPFSVNPSEPSVPNTPYTYDSDSSDDNDEAP